VWAILDAAGMRRFTGELTLASWPLVRAYFNDGELYYAERDGDPSISDRLLEYGVVTPEELVAGTVRLGSVSHLGRLFDRVSTIDRDAVELAVEVITGEVLGAIADHTVDEIVISSYRHHPSGIAKWRRRSNAANDDQLVADYEQMMSAQITPDIEPIVQPFVQAFAEAFEQPPTFEAPVMLAPPATSAVAMPAPCAVTVPTPQPALVPAPPASRPSPYSLQFDLDKVLAQVALENKGLPMPDDSDEVDDGVLAAVREALAEIEAATRPVITDGLSARAFEIALASAPESAADIEPANHPAPGAATSAGPLLPNRSLRPPDHSAPAEAAVTDDDHDRRPAAPHVDADPGTGLRRLIGGTRKT
jgi:hypothetical protein